MQKKHLLLMLLMALLVPLAMNGQNTITLSGNVTQTIEPNTTYTFYDSGGPNSDYGSNERCTATFNASENITLSFTSFETERSSDYMYVYDGTTSGKVLLNKVSGNTIPPSVTAKSGTMTVVWHSDNTNNKAGWVATIQYETRKAYELVTASQTDWSGNYVLVGPWNTYKGYALKGINYYPSSSDGGTTAVTINGTFHGTFLSSIGNADVLTIAKSTQDASCYSIRINGDKYLIASSTGLRTSSNEADSYWSITYTTHGMQIYCPWYYSYRKYLYFVVYRDYDTNEFGGTTFLICREGDFANNELYHFEYILPVLYKETTLAQHNIIVTQSAGGTISADVNKSFMDDMITLSATPDPGYFFAEWKVKDASNNTMYVANNKIIMPNCDVTVTASFTQGLQVKLVQTPNGTISANQTTNLHPGDHVTLTATPDNGCDFLAWYVYRTGNPRDVIHVMNNGFVMPTSDVTVQAAFVTVEGHVQTVGGGSPYTDNHLPTTALLKYSLTQQIYTAAEIGYNGRITKIAFKATSDISNARSLDIYMRHTSKTAFGSSTDWEVMGHDALVYSGNVSFANNDWTTITLDTPFEYDGTSNLNICVVDKTGVRENNSKTFGIYRTNANRSLYICNDNNDYSSSVGDSNLLSNFRGYFLTAPSNNQIVFTIEPSGSAESLSISPDEINNFSYLKGQGPSQAHKLDIVGIDLKNNITLTASDNFEISSTENGPYNSSLTIPRATSKRNRNVQTWDFEDGLQGWTIVDTDDDGYNWEHDTEVGGHGGSTGIVHSQSYYSDGHGNHPLYPDNWLISPQVTLGGSFSLWARVEYYDSDHFAILVSTTNTGSFTLLGEWDLPIYNNNWKQFSVDLSAFAGQTGYIAVRHYNCSDQYYISVDDFELNTGAAIEMPVTITPATVYVRMKGSLGAGTYSGTLTASAGSSTDVNGSVSLSGEVIAANIGLTKEITGYGNGTGNWYLIASPLADNVAPTNVDGMITDDLGDEATPEDATYDLYYFDQTGGGENGDGKEWRNYRATPFVLVNGQGYLYANKEGTTLTFTGMPYSGNTKDVTLTYSTTNSDANMHGWNLVGNPFNEIAYIDMPFYTLDGDSEYVEKAAGDPINPMQGVLVHTDTEVDLTFSTTPLSKSSRLTLNLTQGRSIMDRAILSFDESKPLPKMQLRENSTKVYFPVDGKDYAVVSAEESMGEMPVSFKAEENGIYSLSFNAEDVTFGYLHLIDNMTGNDVDLLATPSYTFEAKTTDYYSRFRLVFATGTTDDDFAFFSNGSFVINNEGNAMLQVIDVNGRIIRSESINGCANVNINAASGIYMLRLVNGDRVKTQKVVVR